jgi:hypothetical protein
MMRRLRLFGLFFAAISLVLVAQSATAKPPPTHVKVTAKPVATLAVDGPRVAYASGGKVYVWNLDTGATSVVKGSYSKAPGELAIAGKRVAYVSRFVTGNTYQTTEHLYTAPVGGAARLLRSAQRYAGEGIGEWYGDWIAGAVGSGNVLAVSTWHSHGLVCTHQALSLVTPTGVKPIVAGPGAMIAASADRGRVAVLRSEDAWPYPVSAPPVRAVTVGVYSAEGKLLAQVVPSSAREIALSGDRLVVLTESKTLEIYAWRTGALLKTLPVATTTPRLQAGHLSVYGNLATYSVDPRYSSARSVHLLSLATGRDVVLATGRSGALGYYGRDVALGSRGLVYAITYHEHHRLGTLQHGKLVFVPTARLLAALAPPKPRILLATGGIDAFAQDAGSIAWVDAGQAVHVRQLSTGKSGVVGWVSSAVIGGGPVAPPALTLAGLRALWPTYAGGMSRETAMKTGALAEKVPPGKTRASIVGIFSYSNDTGDGTYLAGLAGDGATLAYGDTDEFCHDEYCNVVEVDGGGVSLVTGRSKTVELDVPPPALIAVSNGRIAVAPAADHAVPNPTADHPPLPAENGPVQVYDTASHLIAEVHPAGTVNAVAVAWPDLAVLVRRADGSTAVERYDGRTDTLMAVATVSPDVRSISVGSRGIVYADGGRIYLLGSSGPPKILWHSTGQPFGVSIEGARVAWAVSAGGHGYVQALLLGAEG